MHQVWSVQIWYGAGFTSIRQSRWWRMLVLCLAGKSFLGSLIFNCPLIFTFYICIPVLPSFHFFLLNITLALLWTAYWNLSCSVSFLGQEEGAAHSPCSAREASNFHPFLHTAGSIPAENIDVLGSAVDEKGAFWTSSVCGSFHIILLP